MLDNSLQISSCVVHHTGRPGERHIARAARSKQLAVFPCDDVNELLRELKPLGRIAPRTVLPELLRRRPMARRCGGAAVPICQADQLRRIVRKVASLRPGRDDHILARDLPADSGTLVLEPNLGSGGCASGHPVGPTRGTRRGGCPYWAEYGVSPVMVAASVEADPPKEGELDLNDQACGGHRGQRLHVAVGDLVIGAGLDPRRLDFAALLQCACCHQQLHVAWVSLVPKAGVRESQRAVGYLHQ